MAQPTNTAELHQTGLTIKGRKREEPNNLGKSAKTEPTTGGGGVLAKPYLCQAWQTPALSHQTSSGKRG